MHVGSTAGRASDHLYANRLMKSFVPSWWVNAHQGALRGTGHWALERSDCSVSAGEIACSDLHQLLQNLAPVYQLYWMTDCKFVSVTRACSCLLHSPHQRATSPRKKSGADYGETRFGSFSLKASHRFDRGSLYHQSAYIGANWTGLLTKVLHLCTMLLRANIAICL